MEEKVIDILKKWSYFENGQHVLKENDYYIVAFEIIELLQKKNQKLHTP